MAQDLHMSSGTNALAAASFFLGYFLFQIPGTVYAERRSARRLVAWSTVVWGVLAMVQGLLDSAALLIAARFLLGVVEGAVLPSMVMLLSRWFTQRERGRANTFLILGNPVTVMWLSAVSGLLVQATDWRTMFVVEGLPAVVWGLCCLKLIKDHPEEAGWLPAEERASLPTDLAAEQRTQQPPTGAAAYRRVLTSRPVLVLAVQYFCWSIGVYGFVFWLPSIIKHASGEGIGATGLLSAVPYLFAALAMLVNSQLSDRRGRRRTAVWPWLTVAALALYGSYLAEGAFALSFVLLIVAGLCLYAPYGPYFALVSDQAPKNVSGAAVALVNSFGALGSFTGTYLVGWVRGSSLGDAGAFGLMAAGTLVSAALIALVRERPAAPVPAGEEAREPTARPA
jgi:sugar phosphate permease